MLKRFNPEDDGVTHINVYSKAKTELGRFLSNFYHFPVTCGEDGVFSSIEGYWYWLGCSHERREELRSLSGFAAKKLGKELGQTVKVKDFKEKIQKAIRVKVKRSSFKEHFALSELPFTHYYLFGSKQTYDDASEWIIEFLEDLRIKAKTAGES